MRLLLVGVSFVFFFSCGEKIPAGVIPKKQMPDVLLDMHLADGQLSSMPIDSARVYIDNYYQAIFNHYGIDSVRLARSIAYYAHRPHIMNDFYNIVEKRLNALNLEQQQAMDQRYQMQRDADSVKKVLRLESLARVARNSRDSLDMLRKKHLLFLHSAVDSSTYSEPVAVTHERLKSRLWEQLGLLEADGGDDSSEEESLQ